TEVRGDSPASVSAGRTSTRPAIDIQLDRPIGLADQDEVVPFAVVDGRPFYSGRIAGLVPVLTNLRLQVTARKRDVDDGRAVGAVPLGQNGPPACPGLNPAGEGEGRPGREIEPGRIAIIEVILIGLELKGLPADTRNPTAAVDGPGL